MPNKLYNEDWDGYKEPEELKFQPTRKEIDRELSRRDRDYLMNGKLNEDLKIVYRVTSNNVKTFVGLAHLLILAPI